MLRAGQGEGSNVGGRPQHPHTMTYIPGAAEGATEWVRGGLGRKKYIYISPHSFPLPHRKEEGEQRARSNAKPKDHLQYQPAPPDHPTHSKSMVEPSRNVDSANRL